MQIQLDTPLTVQPAKVASVLTIDRVVDAPGRKIVRVFVQEIPTPITLWAGDLYDAAGQYTDTDIQNRLRELLVTTTTTTP